MSAKRRHASITCFILFLTLMFFITSARAEEDKKNKNTIREETRASEKIAPGKEDENDLADLFSSDDDPELWDDIVGKRRTQWHVLNGSYLYIPSRKWRSSQYNGAMTNSFKVADGLRLINKLNYSLYHTTRDKNFPEQLQAFGERIALKGDRFQVSAGVASRSDALFDGLSRINISAGVNGTVYKSGPHSIVIGAIYSSKGEQWKLALPFPLFAYRYQTKTLYVSLGLPLFLAWRAHKNVSISLSGMLPLVGSAKIKFRTCSYFSIILDWVHRKEPFYPKKYPYRDLRYVLYKALGDHSDKHEGGKKFVLDTHRAGLTLEFNYEEYISLFLYGGIQFGSSYYFTSNIFPTGADKDKIRDLLEDKNKIRNSLIIQAGFKTSIYM